MADYKELLRRAVDALPDNNGAARRAVYEKARAALLGQLRAITPPLSARDITQHRLQLEDCIRQVEQETSEAVIKLNRNEAGGRSPFAPQPSKPQAAAPKLAATPVEIAQPQAVATPLPAMAPMPGGFDDEPVEAPPKRTKLSDPASERSRPSGRESIEDIIAAAERASAKRAPRPVEPQPAADPAPLEDDRLIETEAQADVGVADEQPKPAEETSQDPVQDGVPAAEPALPPPVEENDALAPNRGKPGLRQFLKLASRNDGRQPQPAPAVRTAPIVPIETVRAAVGSGGRIEPVGRGQAAAQAIEPTLGAVSEPVVVEAALSSVREVEVEPTPDTREAEGAIERAIQTLDRAARGEESPDDAVVTPIGAGKGERKPVKPDKPGRQNLAAEAQPAAEAEAGSPRRTGGGLSIFLIVFALLLAGVGGAGYWAWREGYVDLDQMFGRAIIADTEPAPITTEPAGPTLSPSTNTAVPAAEQTGPGNTTTETAIAEPTAAIQGLDDEQRLEPTLEPVVPSAEGSTDAALDDERLPNADTEIALADDPVASVDPAALAGSQSLLLEASDDGRTGAVPFSGTVEWTQGVDEIGLPTLMATANIPARNLEIDMTIRRNADPSLPASHLMEVDFNVADTFVGGGISGLPGVLLKNQELVQGTPLVGASARVVGNSFLFALSASEDDAETNRDLLVERKWIDLAVIYSTGKRAIITLEKDEAAEDMFTEVFAEWQEADAE